MDVLTQAQKDAFETDGYLVLESRLSPAELTALHAEVDRYTAKARGLTEGTDELDLEDSHRPDAPRVRRIKLPHTHSQVMADLMRSDTILAPVRDLIGPDLRLHTTKLNMKEAGHGAAVEWHQDFAFYPHTNDDVLAVGVLLDDMGMENGPLMVFPGSHRGPIHDHHANGHFVGAMDLARDGYDMADAVPLMGPAGSISIHHGRIVHGSAVNRSTRARRILFYEMMAADAWPIMGSMTKFSTLEDYDSRMLCGRSRQPRLADIPVRIPLPAPPIGKTIYEIQKGLTARAFETVEQ
ncbi:phytanoyl-CoA dioxygenase family protein [Jannaschia seohaensis]|uniref:Ectoine hydroxylase-related dioxygenase (Phytanoyl-CoA dioxygenase family) n=1 Tax=Jannaschia seohaensis TaxID=475081 RepID=A0A2Y9AMX9_9RHOB|nr:phytanoyl-CoA dioxygenase family protein [Jannaschia seohaensis]PWJ19222.1 ectoine hydroxylase-related dioxygenase (phytanoyl-CoA dioxygenase family) [Jannaschia seohaensis]SSA45884.1 Ectoine hydroxylase-related dioxygenase, phytanoyl-CoA dioxygenase (PhyH) family [Jannaschia seohaensis]